MHTDNICAVGDGSDEIPSYPKGVVDDEGDTMIVGYLSQLSR